MSGRQQPARAGTGGIREGKLDWRGDAGHAVNTRIAVVGDDAAGRCDDGLTVALSDPEVSRTIGVVRRHGAVLSPPAAQFLTMLLEVWRASRPIVGGGA